jgi:predicted DCC family thiol-disulfide oxidoreductase YuxK
MISHWSRHSSSGLPCESIWPVTCTFDLPDVSVTAAKLPSLVRWQHVSNHLLGLIPLPLWFLRVNGEFIPHAHQPLQFQLSLKFTVFNRPFASYHGSLSRVHPIPSFVPGLQDIVLFDGHCVLCNRSVDWVLTRDKRAAIDFFPQFKMAAMQSKAGQAAAHHFGVPEQYRTLNPDSASVVLLISSATGKVGQRCGVCHSTCCMLVCTEDTREALTCALAHSTGPFVSMCVCVCVCSGLHGQQCRLAHCQRVDWCVAAAGSPGGMDSAGHHPRRGVSVYRPSSFALVW